MYLKLLFQRGVKYCFDTVEVKVTGSETHVLVPILRDGRVSVVLESGLEEGTFYTATLIFDSQYIASTKFCEYFLLPSQYIVCISVYCSAHFLLECM